MKGEINMHAAPELGGLGIVLPKGATTRFTSWQRKAAGFLKSRWDRLEFGKSLDIPGPVTKEESRHRIVDLNKPLGVEGRITYQLRLRPKLQWNAPIRPGRVVVREKLEPLREGEERIVTETNTLLNYQGLPTTDHGRWKIKGLDEECRRAIRVFQGREVLEPLSWTREVRSAPSSILDRLERSDSSFIDEWIDDSGVAHSFLAKPIVGC
jgi:hypothetical protein